MNTPDNIQQKAGVIRDFLRENNLNLPHSRALELASRLDGFKDLHHAQKSQRSDGRKVTDIPSGTGERQSFLKAKKMYGAFAMLAVLSNYPEWVAKIELKNSGGIRLKSAMIDSLIDGEFDEILAPKHKEQFLSSLGVETMTIAVVRGPEIAPATSVVIGSASA